MALVLLIHLGMVLAAHQVRLMEMVIAAELVQLLMGQVFAAMVHLMNAVYVAVMQHLKLVVLSNLVLAQLQMVLWKFFFIILYLLPVYSLI